MDAIIKIALVIIAIVFFLCILGIGLPIIAAVLHFLIDMVFSLWFWAILGVILLIKCIFD